MSETSTTTPSGEDDQYTAFLATLRDRFHATTAGDARLFTTSTEGLFDAFLAALPPERRQRYACSNCEAFMNRFGGLVTLSSEGMATSVLWGPEEAPPFFQGAVQAVARLVGRAKVANVFLNQDKTWGLPSNRTDKAPGIWRHMAVTPDAKLIHKPHPILSTSQVAAEKLQDYGTLVRGLAEFPRDIVQQAHTLLTTDSLYRSEKCIGVATWLLDLHEAREATKSAAERENLTWLAVARAPAGFCHVRSSMIGTLLEDIASEMPFDDIKRRFEEKMHPLHYLRPQALPSEGNVAQAEAIIQKLASAGSLARRFARIDEIQAVWKPAPPRQEPRPGADTGGVFSHLKTREAKASAHVEPPLVTMTWEKFARTVLPDVERIELKVSPRKRFYGALVTAVNPDAPPILQWDREEKRNPMSWYLYTEGSQPERWGLVGGSFVPVTAIALQPSMWDEPARYQHQGAMVFFLLEGAKDKDHEKSGGFFPEWLRSEYHSIRKTMEAYAKGATIEGKNEATACGLLLSKGGAAWGDVFRVTSKRACVSYKLDRWD